jgi:Na+-driven multidrug efflux pump
VGLSDTATLAQFSLSLSFAAIFFVALSGLQTGVQNEIAMCLSSGDQVRLSQIFWLSLMIGIVAGVLLSILINIASGPFYAVGDSLLSSGATQSLNIITLSFPLVSTIIILCSYLEVSHRPKMVAKIRMTQTIVQVLLVLVMLFVVKPGVHSERIFGGAWVAIAYVTSDLLVLLWWANAASKKVFRGGQAEDEQGPWRCFTATNRRANG